MLHDLWLEVNKHITYTLNLLMCPKFMRSEETLARRIFVFGQPAGIFCKQINVPRA